MTTRIFHGSIRKKLLLLVLLSALPALGIVFLAGVQNRDKAIAKAERELLFFSRGLAESQERVTFATRTLLDSLSRTPEVRRADPGACHRLFAGLLRANPIYGTFHLIDLEGNALASATPFRPANFAHTKHFQDTVRSRAFSTGEYLLGVTLKIPVFTFGHPVLDEEGTMTGVLLCSIRLDGYGVLFEQTDFPPGSFFGVSDHRGIRLYRHPEGESIPVGKPIRKAVFEAARDAGGPGLVTEKGSDGVERITAFQPLRLAPDREPYMYMFVGAPRDPIHAEARAGMVRDLGLLLLTIVLTLFVGWLLGGRTIARRLEELAVTAGRIGRGDLSARADPSPEIAEIDALGSAFNDMAEALSRDMAGRQAASEALRAAKEAADTASQAKSAFLANMSHEIRTPLNGILGMLQLLEGSARDPEQEEYAREAIQASQRLHRLLSDILDLSRVEAGKLAIQAEPFHLDEALDSVQHLFAPSARNKDVALTFFAHPGVPRTLSGDVVRLQQVLNNLVGNALKFTSEGSVEVEVFPLPAQAPGQARLLFTVRDTGSGIPADRQEALFDPFTQVETGYARDHQGAGLGLAISRHLVTLMGGAIVLESEPGEGTTFFCCIPFDLPPEGSAPAPEAPEPETPDGLLPRLSILLVEDERINRLSAVRLLEKAGHTVVAAENGSQALQALQAGAFDVVLMDIQMPVMDGLAAALAIRRGEAGPAAAGLPIIAMTAFAMAGDRERFLAGGMDGYLAKPVTLKDLERVVGRTLRAARPSPAS